ncbi:DUF177 domain-containing protein [Lutibacter sp.]|uniref:YceD family protein n=1 Tax=Lutibacter sp. TaxID=1925666 RepID=UPI002736D67D|nr:DUF177 domain-containing protein [Lutibacter sp.]MDP3313609.1 DUF177 domain-containing protein [Lutibacter sp.]
MKDLKEFDISFVGLKEGIHQFEYIIEQKFFDFFKYEEFNNSEVTVNLSFLKKATIFELTFNFNGWVELACDLTNELYHYSIKDELNLIIKFGEEYNDENEELLILPHMDFKVNVAQYIYEAIALAIPFKRIHPGVLDGSLSSEILDKLKEFELQSHEELEQEQEAEAETDKEINPVWSKLKNIQIDKNTTNGTS